MTWHFDAWADHPAVQAAGWALLHFVWQAAAVAAVLKGLLAACRSAAATTRYAAATAALFAMAGLPVATFLVLVQRPGTPAPVRVDPPAATAVTGGTVTVGADTPRPAAVTASPGERPARRLRGTTDEAVGTASSPAEPARLTSAPAASTSAPPVSAPSPAGTFEQRLRPALPWLVAAWLAGATVLSLRLAGGWVRLRTVRRRASPPPDAWADRFARLAERVGVRRPVRLWVAASVQAPCALGWLRPMVLVPAAILAELSVPQLEAILAHELAHVRRRDYLVNLLQSAAEVLLFYHPAVWWASGQVRREREHCCDDVAADACGSRLLYARAIATLEERRAGPALALSATGGTLLCRVRRLVLDAPAPAGRAAWWPAGVLALSATLAAGLTVSLGQPTPPAKQPTSSPAAAVRPATRPVNGPATGPSTTQPATTRLTTAPSPLRGRVLTPTGQPAAGATVAAYNGGSRPPRPVGSAIAGADGRYEILPTEPITSLIADGGDAAWAAVGVRDDQSSVDVRLREPAELRVTFRDPDGRPLPDVAVRVVPHGGFGGTRGGESELVGTRRATTDAQGQCRLDRLPPGDRIRFDVADDRFARLDGKSSRVTLSRPTTAAGPVRVWPAGSIGGRVQWVDGRPASGARVNAYSHTDGTLYEATAPADDGGRYRLGRLPPGRYNLRAYSGAGPAYMGPRAFEQSVTLAAKQDLGGQDLTLSRGATINGTVTDKATGQPIRVSVRAWPTDGTNREIGARRVPDGGFTIPVPVGKYRVVVDAVASGIDVASIDPPAQEVVAEEGGIYSADFAVVRRAAAAEPAGNGGGDAKRSVAGQVLDENGNPVAGATIALWPVPGERTAPATAPATGPAVAARADQRGRTTGADGRFNIPDVTGRRLLRANEFTRRAVTVEPVLVAAGDRVTVRVKANGWPIVKGRLTDEAGQPVAGVPVHLAAEWPGQPGTYTVMDVEPAKDHRTDADGRYSVSALYPDLRYCLVAGRTDPYAGRRTEPFDVKAGEPRDAPAVVLTRATGTVGGTVVDPAGKPVAGVTVWLSGPFDRLHQTTDAAGAFRIEAVGDATFELAVHERELGAARVLAKVDTQDNVITLKVP